MLVKLYNFGRRSVWRYALASGGLGAGWALLNADKPSLAGGFGLAALVALAVFAGLCALSGLVMAGSAWLKRETGFRGEITFLAESLLLRPEDASQPAEEKNWAWIARWDESATHFFLLVQAAPQYYLLLTKLGLTEEETTTMRTWLTRPRPSGPAA